MSTIAIPDIELGVPRLNSRGYPDSTACRALRNVQRAEFGHRPLIYICSPYSGNVAANVELARAFCAFAVTQRVIPLAPHLLFPQLMDDADSDQRELAMFFNRVLLSKCDGIWVYIARGSPGMRTEIDWVQGMGLPVSFFDADFEEVIADA